MATQGTYTFTCTHCGKTATAYASQKGRKFCSKACNYAHKQVEKTCAICGETFRAGKTRGSEQVTCRSEECKKAIKFGEYNPFHGRKHSEESKTKVSIANSKPHKEVQCTCGCGEIIELPPHRIRYSKTNMFFFNREHMSNWLIGENHWTYRGGNIYYGDGWTRIARAIRERDKVCQMCGKTPEENGRSLDVHHKVPARISQDNSPENLIALCMSCHHSINVLEQYEFPIKVCKYRKCLNCDKVFTPQAFQKFCSDECRRQRARKAEKKYVDTHPEAYQKRRQRIKAWQQANKDKVNASHQLSRQRRRNHQEQQNLKLFD